MTPSISPARQAMIDEIEALLAERQGKSNLPGGTMPGVSNPQTGQPIPLPGQPPVQMPQDFTDRERFIPHPVDPNDSSIEGSIDRAAQSAATVMNPMTLAKSLYQTMRHPLDTLTGIYDQGKELGQQADEDLKAGNTGTGILRKAASIIPIAGPVANDLVTKAATGKAPEAVGESIGTAYTFATPALLGKKLSGPLTRSAERNYLGALAPDSKLTLPKAEETAAMLAKDKVVAGSRDSLTEQMKSKADAIGPTVGDQYSQVAPVGPANVQKVYDAIEELRKKHVTVKGTKVDVNPNIARALDDLEVTVMDMQDTLGNISAEALDDFRDKLFRGNVGATGNLRAAAPESAAAIEKSTARIIREVLDSQYPDEGAINRIYHLTKKAEEFSKNAGQVEKLRDLKTPTDLGSSVVRVIPQKVKLAANVFNSVPWNTMSGATKQSIAELLAAGKFEQAQKIMQSAAATKGATERIYSDPFRDLTPEQRRQALMNIQRDGTADITVNGQRRMWRKQSDGTVRRLR